MAPKNVLPVSPINIFAGLQLSIKKTNKEPISIENSGLIKSIDLNKIKNMQPDKSPSNPSIKLKRFIMQKPTITIKLKIIKLRIFELI